MLLLCLSILSGWADAPQSEIGLQVVGDWVFISVTSRVQFTVWSTCNLAKTALWWHLYTSPVPAPGQTIVWLGCTDKAGVFPAYNFFRVTPAWTPTK
jgi:hypothetical protein